MSVLPAKAFGIYGKKGDIKPGFDADLLIVDPDKEWEITEESLLYVNKISAFVGLNFWLKDGCALVKRSFLDYVFIAEGQVMSTGLSRNIFIGPVSPDYESLNYGQAMEAMDMIKEFDGRAGFHCEDYAIIKNQEKRMKEAGRFFPFGQNCGNPALFDCYITFCYGICRNNLTIFN